MVYDDRSNFVGDTHWRGDELGEGEELELDRRGILVEVGEHTGQKNQDVSELTDKPRKDKEDRAAARAAATPVAARHGTPSGSEFLRPKPLNQMLTPSGHYGRAVIPITSPFEERQKSTGRTTDENERPAKRRKQEDISSKSGYAHNLMGASLNLSYSRPPSTASIRHEPLKLKTAPIRKADVTIDLTEDSDNEGSVSGCRNGGREELRQRERPSIQKRQKKSPKSTYAGNLTGAALSLSRPADFQSSRPEFQISRTSVWLGEIDDKEPSAADEDGFATAAACGKQYALAGKTKGSRTDTMAGSLSLKNIFESGSSSPLRVDRESSAPRVSKSKRTENSRSSSPERQERPKQAQRVEARTSSPDLESPPPPSVAQSRKLSKELGSFRQSTIQESSMNQVGSDKAMSSLRIKPRPPRKMMMLMDCPSSRQSGRALSSGNIITHKSKERSRAAKDDVVLSQATVKLDAFCQRQEARLQARLNGQRSRIDDGDLSDSPPDSGIDHETIDLLLSRGVELGEARLVDKPRPPSQQAKKPSEVVNRAGGLSEINSDREIASLGSTYEIIYKTQSAPTAEILPKVVVRPGSEQPVEEFGLDQGLERSTSGGSESSGGVHKSDNIASTPAPATPDMLNSMRASEQYISSNESHGPTDSRSLHMPELDTTVPNSEAEEQSTVACSNVPTIENADEFVVRSLLSRSQGSIDIPSLGLDKQKTGSNIAPDTTIKGDSNPSREEQNKPKRHVDTNEAPSNAPLEDSRAIISVSDPRMKDLPWHMTNAIQGAVAHPRVKLDSPTGRLEKAAVPFAPQSEETRSIQKLNTITGTLSKAESISRGLVTKSSPKPTPIVLDALQKTSPQNGNGFFRDRDSVTTPTQGVATIAPKGMENPPPRARMANPATSGRSLQSIAANTLNTVAPAFIGVMPPPPPRLLSRINRTNPREDAARGRTDAAPLREELKGGPWSRESFDLFGSWKPPDRNAGTNVTAA